MDKIATRAWKKNYGNLSEATKQRLVDTGVHNYKKELIGLNKGTRRILKKNNARALFGKKQIMETIKKDYPNMSKRRIKKYIEDGVTITIPDRYRKAHPDSPQYYTLFLSRRASDHKVIDDVLGEFSPNSKLNKNDALGRLYADALIRRHEADEVRANVANKKHKGWDFMNNLDPLSSATQITGHADPSVIMRESANVALAPKSTKEYSKGFRVRDNHSSKAKVWQLKNQSLSGVDNYADRMKLFGNKYGQDAVFNKKQYRAFKAGNRNLVNNVASKVPTRFDKMFERANKNISDLMPNKAKPMMINVPYFRRVFFKKSDLRKAERDIYTALQKDSYAFPSRSPLRSRLRNAQLKPMRGTFKLSDK